MPSLDNSLIEKRTRIIQEYNYDAYGNAIVFVPKNALANLLYSGEQYNPVSGLQYLRARWYNPENGRFNRLDPYAGNKQSPLSFHKYAYAHMNPVMGKDPTGMWTLTQMVLVSGIIGSLAGIGVGAYWGYVRNGTLFSLDTLYRIFISGVAGFGIGVLTAAIGIKAAGIGTGLRIAVSRFSPSLIAVNKGIWQAQRIFSATSLKKGAGLTLGWFIAGAYAGIIAKATGEKYSSQITEAALLSLGGIPIGSTLTSSFKVARTFGILGWAFALGFNATYFGIDAVDAVIQKITDSE